MSIYLDIVEAAHRARAHICRGPLGPRLCHIARDILRIEVSRDTMSEIFMEMRREQDIYSYMRGEMEGPPKIVGVALYEVGALPAPGWRVVNPLEDLR